MNLNKQEVIDWIESQPDERAVDMDQAYLIGPDQCGCLLVHLYRNYIGPAYNITCGWGTARSVDFDRFDPARSILSPDVRHFSTAKTYADLKRLAKTW